MTTYLWQGVESSWTEAKEQKLRRLWLDRPDLTASEIGYKLGFSKNAVCGKRFRMGLPKRQSPIKTAGLYPNKKARHRRIPGIFFKKPDQRY